MADTAKNNRNYGFRAEAELLQYFRDHGAEAERLMLAGTEDEGDLVVKFPELFGEEKDDYPTIVQLKTFAMRSANGSERSLTPGRVKAWLEDLDAQRGHYKAHRGLSRTPAGKLVVKFKNHPWEDALVIDRLENWAG